MTTTAYLIEALEAAGCDEIARKCSALYSYINERGDKIGLSEVLEELREGVPLYDEKMANAAPFPPLDLMQAIEDPPPTWSTGLPWWDSAMADGGMQAGWKIVLAAPPGCGKTALVLQVLRGFLRNHTNARALYMAGEMSRRQLAMRVVQQESGLPAYALTIGMPDQVRRRDAAMERLETISPRLHVMDPPIDVAKLRACAHVYPLIVVDYLQLCRPADLSAGRVEQIDQIMVELTTIAANSGSTFVIISAMPRGGATTKSRNIFEAFKGSSAIEYAADVAFVGEVNQEDEGDDRGVLWRCLKNRHGPTVDLDLIFRGPSMRFDQAEPEPEPKPKPKPKPKPRQALSRESPP